MSLNLVALGQQVRAMTGKLTVSSDSYHRRCKDARDRYMNEAGAHSTWAQLAEVSCPTVPFLLAHPLEPLDTVYNLPPCPDSYALVATDGSQMDVDRHGIAPFSLVNIGRVFLRYGNTPSARLSSTATLWCDDEMFTVDSSDQQPVLKGGYLSARRDLAEIQEVVTLVDEFLYPDLPAIALLDGTLIRWNLAGADPRLQQHLLQPYLDALSALRERGVPVASYISRPRASEVIGTIRLMYCPDVHNDSDRGAICQACSDMAAGRAPSCGVLRGLTDADVLMGALADGQRGPLFRSLSRINTVHYGEHLVHFFYLHIGPEMVRVEVPGWVAEDPVRLGRVHALIYDQVIRGQGYPVGLARAHEQAIVRGSDRRALLRMIEQSLVRSGLPARPSRKAASKARQAL